VLELLIHGIRGNNMWTFVLSFLFISHYGSTYDLGALSTHSTKEKCEKALLNFDFNKRSYTGYKSTTFKDGKYKIELEHGRWIITCDLAKMEK